MIYRLIEENEVEYADIYNIKSFEFGCGRIFYVLKDNEPYIRLVIDDGFFKDIVIFNEYVFIGDYTNGVKVFNLKDYTINNIDVDGYFGHFHIDNDMLFVLGCSNVMAFDKSSKVIWKSKDIAIDGIVFDHISNNTMYVECEMDPPGGWETRCINISNGMIE